MYLLAEYRLILAFTERTYTTPQVDRMFRCESLLPALR
jgi:hypothetical protein